MYMETTIRLNTEVKNQLDKLKIHTRESYNEVLRRLIEECKNVGVDSESLTETIEILSEPKTLMEIAEALNEFESGKSISWEKIKKENLLNV